MVFATKRQSHSVVLGTVAEQVVVPAPRGH
jgi:hypothetical protein